MNIINVNSRYGLDPTIVQYAHAIAESYDRYADKGPYCRDSLTDLMNRIPVLLLKEASMPPVPDVTKGIEAAEDVATVIDLWGYYQHAFPITPTDKIPVIALCLERIVNHCLREDGTLDTETYSILTAKVIIHEYAHAMMALPYGAAGVTYENFYLWMEESMANAFTLKCFEAHARSGSHHQCYTPTQGHRVTHSTPSFSLNPLAVVTQFMLKQPAHYALGAFMHEHGLGHHWLWSMNKQSCNTRSNAKSDWLTIARKVSAIGSNAQPPLNIADFAKCFYDVFSTTQADIAAMRVLHPQEELLLRAVLAGDVKECRDILSQRDTSGAPLVNVNCTDINGWTPFQWVKHVAHQNKVEVATILVEYGADVAKAIESIDDFEDHFGEDLNWLQDPLRDKLRKHRRSRSAFGRF